MEVAIARRHHVRTWAVLPSAVVDVGMGEALYDTSDGLIDVGRMLAAAVSAAAVESAIEDAGVQLLGGAGCTLVPLGEAAAEDPPALLGVPATALLERAVELGRPVAGDDLLAAPVLVHGEARLGFVLTGRPGRAFGAEQVRLASFVAALAGAAFEHLAGTEARLRSLAQNSSDVITVVDRAGVVEYQSEAAGRVFGNAAATVVGRQVRDWAHPEDAALFDAALQEAGRGRQSRVECRMRHADGTFRHAETSITNLLDVPHLSALVLNTRDVTDRRDLEDELRRRALHDALTGLPNRALLLDRAQHALDRARRSRAPLVVGFLDLDDFKSVNDTYGHRAGDELLVEMARRLVGCVRPADTVARLGGDEFAVLLEDTDLATARLVVDRMLAAVAAPVVVAGDEVVVSLSVGLAQSSTAHDDPDQLLVEADTAMYAAKQRGKHCQDVFVPAMKAAAERRSRLRTELERAVSGDQLRLHYQPIVSLEDESRVGVEALVRWHHPERGLLPPSDFVDFAEDSGQIVRIGAWVLRTACADAARLGPAARMSVNVSGRQLRSAGLVAEVARALTDSGLAPSRLLLEITETATLGGDEAQTRETIGVLTRLKELGVQLALDDFGTGFSPLSHLRRFPVDLLKIDRSFVAGLTTSRQDEAIVRTVVDLAHAFGVRVVAEGVEETAQRDALRALGCDLAQGFLWQRPVEMRRLVGPADVPPPPRSGLRDGAPLRAAGGRGGAR